MTTASVAVTMKAAQVAEAGASLRMVELEVPEPGPGQVRIKVKACGVCHSDAMIVEGLRPGIAYPRVPGHEVAGIVDALGPQVTDWKKGRRVGVGWHGGHDGTCPECRRGDFRLCRHEQNPGLSYDGGYQEYMLAPVEALVPIPHSLSDVDVAPLLCAGSNTFNALRYAGAMPGELVAVQGIGGLGHLGIQFANKLGYKVAAVGRGSHIESLATELGADVYIDSKAKDAAAELQKLGGARVILATAPDSKAMSELVGGLAPNGKLILVGVSLGLIQFAPVQLIRGGKTIEGWAGVTPADSEDTLRFAELRSVRPMVETFPLEKAAAAYARMMSGDAEFRVVLTM
jgi:D-arabinose 1-dehydrogenase-like Zn-dependent alcohol dehydrogenase